MFLTCTFVNSEVAGAARCRLLCHESFQPDNVELVLQVIRPQNFSFKLSYQARDLLLQPCKFNAATSAFDAWLPSSKAVASAAFLPSSNPFANPSTKPLVSAALLRLARVALFLESPLISPSPSPCF